VAPRPVIIVPGAVSAAPMYLYVPVTEQHNWRHYCRRYDACGRQVYFVREDWVRDRYSHEHPGWDHGHGPHGQSDHRHDNEHDHDRDHRH
jgi:hypothetical protein